MDNLHKAVGTAVIPSALDLVGGARAVRLVKLGSDCPNVVKAGMG